MRFSPVAAYTALDEPQDNSAKPNMTVEEQRAAAWLRAWDGQDIHRTGTAGDAAGAEWLAAEARALGAEARVEHFALERLDPIECFLEIGGERIEGVPV